MIAYRTRCHTFSFLQSLTLAAMVLPTHAQPLASESFEYAGDTFIQDMNGGKGFAERWLGQPSFYAEDARVVYPSLEYPGYTSAGGAATMSRGNYRDAHRKLDTTAAGPFAAYLDASNRIGKDDTEVWISYLAKDGDPAPGGGFPSLRFYRNPADAQEPSEKEVVLALPLEAATDGKTHLLVAHIAFAQGQDKVTVYVNPGLSQAPSGGLPMDATKTVDVSFDTLEISGEFYVEPAPSVTWDEIRIAADPQQIGFATGLSEPK
jgi:hypothetical protein